MSYAAVGAGSVLSGRYRLLEPLASGGMGTVWRAVDLLLDRPVAIKEVRLPPGLDDEARTTLRRRTIREAQAAARLRHGAIVTVYDVVEQDDRPWIVMELVPSRSLAQVIRDDGPLPPARVASIGLRVLGAMVTADAGGVQHRDIKPANVLITDEGRVVLTDFGIARQIGDETLTSAGLLLGSPDYLAPERARGQRSPGLASDLWSLGALMYDAVEGRRPFDRDGPLPTLAAVVMDEPPPPVRAGPLRPVIDGLLVKDPAHRLDAARTQAMLERIVRGRPTSGTMPLRSAPGAPLGAERRPAPPTAAARLESRPAPPKPVGPVPTPATGPEPTPVEPAQARSATPNRVVPARAPTAGAESTRIEPAETQPADTRPAPQADHVSPAETRPADTRPAPQADHVSPAETRPAETQPAPQADHVDPAKTRPAETRPAPDQERLGPAETRPAPGPGGLVPAEDRPDRDGRTVPSRRRTAVLAALALAVVAVIAAVLLPRALSDEPGTRAAPPGTTAAAGSAPAAATQASTAPSSTAAPSTAAPKPSPKAAPTAAPTGAAVTAPAGFTRYTDPRDGFSVIVPTGWRPVRRDTLVDFDDPTSSRFLRIDTSDKPKPDPYQNWIDNERSFRQSHANYRKLGITRVPGYRPGSGWTTADWEFTLGGTHVLDRNIRVSDSRAHAIYWSTPSSRWNTADSRRIFGLAAASFVPAPTRS
jgi:eukaryotic-like serine/threonine-protein kinase